MNIIAITGVHGSGKTFLMNKLKRRSLESGKTVYTVSEVARKCPYKLGTVDAQDYIWRNQMGQEKFAMRQDVDTILLDRSIMDNLMYYYAVLEDVVGMQEHMGVWHRWSCLYEHAVAWMPRYDIVIRLPMNLEYIRNDDDHIRPKDEAYARRIDKLFDRYVDPFVTNYSWV